MELTGKVVIITGGAGNLGSACAREVARQGAKVVVSDLMDELALRRASVCPTTSRTWLSSSHPIRRLNITGQTFVVDGGGTAHQPWVRVN